MKILVKLKVTLLVFSIIFASQSIAADRILPLPKPLVEKDIINKTAKKKEIYPQKKPQLKKEKVEIDESKEIEEVVDEIVIYPKKKPLKEGKEQSYYEDGKIKTETNWKDGKPDGLWKEWHENGQLKKEVNYKEGSRHGIYKEWYEGGQIQKEKKYFLILEGL